MKTTFRLGTLFALTLLVGTATAGPVRFTLDYQEIGGYCYGDGSAAIYEIWELGSRIRAGRLEFSILMDLPQTGATADDSYADDVLLTPGDLWITVGSRNPFASGMTRHAIALTTHDNVVQQAYTGEAWPTVTQGDLYKNAQYATGTFETYQEFMVTNNYWYSPDDRDGDNQSNSYMTMIKGFDQEVAGQSEAVWTLEPYWYYDEVAQEWKLQDSWRVTGYVELSAIGLTPGTPYSLFTASECGNDGAVHASLVPESAATSLLFLGLLAVRRRRK